jgi:hypothetical protein
MSKDDNDNGTCEIAKEGGPLTEDVCIHDNEGCENPSCENPREVEETLSDNADGRWKQKETIWKEKGWGRYHAKVVQR